MIKLRRSAERGTTQLDWLLSRHTFSFGEYHDARYTGFGDLVVINEDIVAPGRGFNPHGHRDMEIVSYVLAGELAHRDSTGENSTIRPGQIQRMSAGTGVMHSEFNPSALQPVHFLQIWIIPDQRGLPPGYEEKTFANEPREGRLRLIAAPDGRDGALTLHQDATLYEAQLKPGDEVEHELRAGRRAWLQVTRGALTVNDKPLGAGDGAAVHAEARLVVKASEPCDFLLFDLR